MSGEPKFGGTIDLEAGTATRAKDGEQPPADPVTPSDDSAAASGGDGGGNQSDAGAATAAAAQQQPDAAAQAAAVDQAKNLTDYLKNWNEKAGTQFQTEDELINEIKSGRDLKTKITDYEKKLGELSVLDDPFVRDIAKVKKAGIGIELYLDALKTDVDKLAGKEALKKDFLLKNADLVATDPEFAGMTFERDYQARYGKLSDKLDVAGLDEVEAREKTLEFNREQDFIKRSLAVAETQAKKSISEWKKQNITIPDVPQQQGMTDDQIQRYKQQVDLFIGQNEKVEIPVTDKLNFNFGLKDYKETLKNELLNPFETLKKLGIDVETGIIDSTKLGKFLIDAHMGKNMAKPLSDWAVDARNIEFLKQKIVQPAPTQPIAAGAAASDSDDIFDRFAKGVAAQRAEAQRQS